MQATEIETIEVNGVKYIKEGTQVTPPKPGKRAPLLLWTAAGFSRGRDTRRWPHQAVARCACPFVAVRGI